MTWYLYRSVTEFGWRFGKRAVNNPRGVIIVHAQAGVQREDLCEIQSHPRAPKAQPVLKKEQTRALYHGRGETPRRPLFRQYRSSVEDPLTASYSSDLHTVHGVQTMLEIAVAAAPFTKPFGQVLDRAAQRRLVNFVGGRSSYSDDEHTLCL